MTRSHKNKQLGPFPIIEMGYRISNKIHYVTVRSLSRRDSNQLTYCYNSIDASFSMQMLIQIFDNVSQAETLHH